MTNRFLLALLLAAAIAPVAAAEETGSPPTARTVDAVDIGLVYAGLGWTDQAFEYLYKAHQERSGWLTYLKVEPRLDNLRSDPRFKNLLELVKLADPLDTIDAAPAGAQYDRGWCV